MQIIQVQIKTQLPIVLDYKLKWIQILSIFFIVISIDQMDAENNQGIAPAANQAGQQQEQLVNPQVRRFEQQQRRQEQVRQNIERIKTPIQKIQAIPILRLDEGVCESVQEEFRNMCLKVSYVLLPRNDAHTIRLRNWDLWGPFFMIVVYAFFIDNSTQLLLLFFSLAIGALIVTFNVVALGGKVSFFQTFSILSYCIFPIFACVMIQKALRFFQLKSRIITVFFILITVCWSIISVRIFIGVNVQENRKFVATYPAALYYIFVGIMLGFNY